MSKQEEVRQKTPFDLRAAYLSRHRWPRDGNTQPITALDHLRRLHFDMYSPPQAATRTYRWAEDAWCQGYLRAETFLLITRDVWKAIEEHNHEMEERWDAGAALETGKDIAAEERFLRLRARKGHRDELAWRRLGEAMKAYRERTEQWELSRQQRQEARRQIQLLTEGRMTLQAARRYLREVARSQPPELELARTSPTS